MSTSDVIRKAPRKHLSTMSLVNPSQLRRWLVILASHVAMCFSGGSYGVVGILILEWRQYFGSSSASVSVIGSIYSPFLYCTGFIAGVLCKKRGCRQVTFAGGVVSALGLALSYLATDPLVLCITVGVISGVGMGLTQTAAQCVVAEYFDDIWFPTANGISNAGMAIGTMLLPPLYQALIDLYGWKGALFLMSGVTLHVCVCGMLFRPLKKRDTCKSSKLETFKSEPLNQMVAGVAGEGKIPSPIILKRALLLPVQATSVTIHEKQDLSFNRLKPMNHHHDRIPSFTSETDGLKSEHAVKCVKDEQKGSSMETLTKVRDTASGIKVLDIQTNPNECKNAKYATDDRGETVVKPMEGNNHPVITSEETTSQLKHRGFGCRRYPLTASLRRSAKYLRLTLFRKYPGFALLAFLQLPYGIGYTGFFFHLVSNVAHSGTNEFKASLLMSLLGVGNAIGRFTNGLFLRVKLITPLRVFGCGMFMSGLACAGIRLMNVYWWYVVCSLIFGLSTGVIYGCLMVLLKKCVGTDEVAAALGLTMTMMGFGDVIGATLAGYLYDVTNNYDLSFFLGGALMMVSGLLHLFVPLLDGKSEEATVEETTDDQSPTGKHRNVERESSC